MTVIVMVHYALLWELYHKAGGRSPFLLLLTFCLFIADIDLERPVIRITAQGDVTRCFSVCLGPFSKEPSTDTVP